MISLKSWIRLPQDAETDRKDKLRATLVYITFWHDIHVLVKMFTKKWKKSDDIVLIRMCSKLKTVIEVLTSEISWRKLAPFSTNLYLNNSSKDIKKINWHYISCFIWRSAGLFYWIDKLYFNDFFVWFHLRSFDFFFLKMTNPRKKKQWV